MPHPHGFPTAYPLTDSILELLGLKPALDVSILSEKPPPTTAAGQSFRVTLFHCTRGYTAVGGDPHIRKSFRAEHGGTHLQSQHPNTEAGRGQPEVRIARIGQNGGEQCKDSSAEKELTVHG